jgi:CBS domain-containing protein
MTPDPACCSANTMLDQVAKMMVQNDCGEIPIVDTANRPVGVVTDRDIVCRVVAEGKNPAGHTAESAMTGMVVTVSADATLDDVVATMAEHQIRRVLVVDEGGCCAGIIAQADIRKRATTSTRARRKRLTATIVTTKASSVNNAMIDKAHP